MLSEHLGSTRFSVCLCYSCCFFFFFNDTATTEIYTLSLHDALPISIGNTSKTSACVGGLAIHWKVKSCSSMVRRRLQQALGDRKSTRLNSSHLVISYAVFCLKKKKKNALDIHPLHHSNCVLTIHRYS